MSPSLKFLLLLLCGLALSVHGGEIINGEKVPDSEMQYMVSVQSPRAHHICGGFLISEDVVVTAAHCDKDDPTNVVLGTHNLQKIVDGTMRYAVKTRCKHGSYNNITKEHDIMLLKLSRKVQMNKTRIKTIKLPKAEIKMKDGDTCWVAGWGVDTPGGKYSTDELRWVDVSYMSLDKCKEEWKDDPPPLPDTVMCAGGFTPDGKGACQGDSGGPLVCKGKPVGIVSFNVEKDDKGNCAYPDRPNVYTNLAKYIKWIDETMKRKDC